MSGRDDTKVLWAIVLIGLSWIGWVSWNLASQHKEKQNELDEHLRQYHPELVSDD